MPTPRWARTEGEPNALRHMHSGPPFLPDPPAVETLVRTALETVDKTLHDHPETARKQVWSVLTAAAVPHQLDADLLAALLETPRPEAEAMLTLLKKLPCRIGENDRRNGPLMLPEALRRAIRRHLQRWHPGRWKALSQRAHHQFKKRPGIGARIEALYHQFACNPGTAAWQCRKLADYLRDHHLKESQDRLVQHLTELTATLPLQGPALVEAMLATLWIRAARGETHELKQETRQVLALAAETAPPGRLADAFILYGDVLKAQAKPQPAANAYQHALTIFHHLLAADPENASWQRELALVHARIGLLHVEKQWFTAARCAFEKCRDIRKQLCQQCPADSIRRKEHFTILSLLRELPPAEKNP